MNEYDFLTDYFKSAENKNASEINYAPYTFDANISNFGAGTNYSLNVEALRAYETASFTSGKKYYTAEEFENLSFEQQNEYLDSITSISNIGELSYAVAKSPFVLGYVMDSLNVDESAKKLLISIATKNGANVYDLLDRDSKISNETIINIAVANQPHLIFELQSDKTLQDMITPDAFIEAFAKNPTVLISDCKALKAKLRLKVQRKDGTEVTYNTTVRTQCMRAINLFYRDRKSKSDYDAFARTILQKICCEDEFYKQLRDRTMLTRSTTSANECIKRRVEDARFLPAQSLRLNKNKVLYSVPRQAKKEQTKESYDYYKNVMLQFLRSSSINTLPEKTKENLVRRCVSIWPEIFFELKNINTLKLTASSLPVQMSAYKAMKDRKLEDMKAEFVAEIGGADTKKVEARTKANATRKKNKINAKKQSQSTATATPADEKAQEKC